MQGLGSMRRSRPRAEPKSAQKLALRSDPVRLERTTCRYLKGFSWRWVATMQIGLGCTTDLKASGLPAGRLIVKVRKHMVAVIDGAIHDTYDPSRGGARCVYGTGSRANVEIRTAQRVSVGTQFCDFRSMRSRPLSRSSAYRTFEARLSRKPGPLPSDGDRNSIPPCSSARPIFVRVPMRASPFSCSRRATAFNDTFAASASSCCVQPSKTLAARIWEEEMRSTGPISRFWRRMLGAGGG